MVMVRRTALGLGLGLGLVLSARPLLAHNNPTMREVALLEIDIASDPAGDGRTYSSVFELAPPKRTVELAWRTAEPAAPGLRFALARAGEIVASDLAPGATTRLFKGPGYTIVNVAGATAPFRLLIVASVAEWPAAT